MAAPVVLESVLCATLQWTNMLRSQLDDAGTGTGTAVLVLQFSSVSTGTGTAAVLVLVIHYWYKLVDKLGNGPCLSNTLRRYLIRPYLVLRVQQ